MPLSEEARKNKISYTAKRNARTERLFAIHFQKERDADVIKKLESVPNKVEYLCRLIREDMEKNK